MRLGIERRSAPRPGRRRVGESPVTTRAVASTTVVYLADERVAMARERKRRAGALTASEREEIRVGIEASESDDAIGRRIGCHRSTLWREITANGGREHYRAAVGEVRAVEAARRHKVLGPTSAPGCGRR